MLNEGRPRWGMYPRDIHMVREQFPGRRRCLRSCARNKLWIADGTCGWHSCLREKGFGGSDHGFEKTFTLLIS